jgi:RNA polymerase sigma factor for flagellar operon FliA
MSVDQSLTALIEDHLALVRPIAVGIGRNVPGLDLSELDSAGRDGLIKAALSFEASRGVPFAAWARCKIRGAILDWVELQVDARQASAAVDPAAIVDPASDPEARAIAVEQSECAERVIAALPAVQLELLRLRHVQGLSIGAAAKSAGISERVADREMRKARARLARCRGQLMPEALAAALFGLRRL